MKEQSIIVFSIIIPVHNGEKYLRDCLDSCLEQDFPRSDYEIICIDDGSTDGSPAILREYEANNKNIRVFALSKNMGVSATRNAGLEQSRGDWCLFLDCDDFLTDNCLSKAKDHLGDSRDSVLCVGRVRFEDGKRDRREYAKSGTYVGCINRYITNWFIPARYATQIRFKKKVRYGEDELFGLEMRILFDPNVIKIDEPMYFYRIHADQSMALNTVDKRVKRLHSVIYSAVYVRKKYGLQNPIVFRFFKERVSVALDEIAGFRFYRRFFYLIGMKLHDLIVLKKNDTKGRGSLSEYWKNLIGERKRLFIEKKKKR